MTANYDRILVVTASTKRSAISSGKRPTPTTYLASISVSSMFPISAEIRERLALEAPHELLQCFTQNVDIVEGDVLVVGTKEYPIAAVEDWPASPSNTTAAFKMLVLEDLKL